MKKIRYTIMYGGFFIGGDGVSTIKKVIPKENYCLEVLLENGSYVILDM